MRRVLVGVILLAGVALGPAQSDAQDQQSCLTDTARIEQARESLKLLEARLSREGVTNLRHVLTRLLTMLGQLLTPGECAVPPPPPPPDPEPVACVTTEQIVSTSWSGVCSPDATSSLGGIETGTALYEKIVVEPAQHGGTCDLTPVTKPVKRECSLPPPPPPDPEPPPDPDPLPEAGWALICEPNGTSKGTCAIGSSWPMARGYNWALPFDTFNREFLYFGAEPNSPSIYSSALYGYSTRTHAFTLRASNGSTVLNPDDCGSDKNISANRINAQNYNPLSGHPLGMMAFDSIRNLWLAQGGLCTGYNNGFTSVYDAITKTMRPLLPIWEFSPESDGNYNAQGHGWSQGMVFVPDYGKTIICCVGKNDGGLKVTEFDGTAYVDVTAQQSGDLPKSRTNNPPLSGGSMLTDGTFAYLFGGCIGTSPGNGTLTGYTCSGTPSNDLYRYDPVTKVWTKLQPVNGVKPSAIYASIPMIAFDSRRDRFVYYDPGTREQWQYLLSTNTWSTFQTQGSGPDHSQLTGIVSVGSANAAGYDPDTDTMVVVWSLGQIKTTGLAELRFGGAPTPEPEPTPDPEPEPPPPPPTEVCGDGIDNDRDGLVDEGCAPPPPPEPSGPLNVPLTVQEAIYPGAASVPRPEPERLTVGLPLPESAGITEATQLGLSGVAVGQFRVLGRWPSGRAKWVLVDTLTQPGAGALTLTTGAGNFGGIPLAVDLGDRIGIDTGTGLFVVRKAGFNVIDSAVVSGVVRITPGSSQGLVLVGPDPQATYQEAGATLRQPTCNAGCATVYTSANDFLSTAEIEENGPVKAVIKATGTHRSANGDGYLHFTTRLTFTKDTGQVTVVNTLRNADYGPSRTFPSAYKSFESYELRLAHALTGANRVAIGTHDLPVTGTLGPAGSATIYQGSSKLMEHLHWGAVYTVPPTRDPFRYAVTMNGSEVFGGDTSATGKQYPSGWMNVSDANGAGLSIGVYQYAAFWPKSLEVHAGGSDVRIGIWPKQSQTPYTQAWPQYTVEQLYLDFHDARPSMRDPFKRWQHYLVARAPIDHYNAAGVFPYPLIPPQEEDDYFKAAGASATPAVGLITNPARWCCLPDLGITNPAMFPLTVYRYYGWGSAGGGNASNEFENRQSFLFNFLMRGMTGRYLTAAHSYRFQTEEVFPRSDGFTWRDRPITEINSLGFPEAILSANAVIDAAGNRTADRSWVDAEHAHWYGVTDFYFMTGDESIKDAILDGPKDRYLNTKLIINNGRQYNTRAVGHQLAAAARLGSFLRDIGDPDADAAFALGIRTYELQVRPELCVDGYPKGCVYGDPHNYLTWARGGGTSRARGLQYGESGLFAPCPNTGGSVRALSALFSSILQFGLLDLRDALGPGWVYYEEATDLLDGLSTHALSNELFQWDGTMNWQTNHVRNAVMIDVPNDCQFYFTNKDYIGSTVLAPFYLRGAVFGDRSWEPKFKIQLQRVMALAAMYNLPEMSSYQTFAAIDTLKRPRPALVSVPFTLAETAPGTYRLSWTVPQGAESYRIKWSPLQIVEWFGTDYDAATATWTADPSTKVNWFAAQNVTDEPAPAAAGTVQTYTVSGLPAGLTASNFALKATVR